MSLHPPALRGSLAPVPAAAPAIAAPAIFAHDVALAEPVSDVARALLARVPQSHPDSELGLWGTLPEEIQSEVKDLLGAFASVEDSPSVLAWAKMVARSTVGRRYDWSVARLRTLFAVYQKSHDWVSLVNRAKAGAAWWSGSKRGLPAEFLRFVSQRFAMFRRDDGCEAAIRSILTQWRTGRDRQGRPAPVPGYGFWQDWFSAQHPGAPLPPIAPIPPGWSPDNLRRKARLSPAVKALCHQGIAAARSFTPGVLTTRADLRFLEIVEFDDVKTDWRILDPMTGQVMDLWLLVARDRATGLLLGFGMRPARAREDGSQEHLRLRDMKQLAGWILERWGLPVGYTVTWKVENGTATFSDAVALALGRLFGERLRISFARMIGGKSPAGYKEKGKGNSNAKASLESLNRPLHTDGSDLPGQTGRNYEHRPADLPAVEKESHETWDLAQYLPAHLRGKERYALLTLTQAREELFRIFNTQNNRSDHGMEGFEKVVEWRPNVSSAWQPQSTVPDQLPEGAEFRTRVISPLERAKRLSDGVLFERVSPVLMRTFFETTQRLVPVSQRGEISFETDDRRLTFADPRGPGPLRLPPLAKYLAYFSAEDPGFLHLFHPQTGAYLATWIRRGRTALTDPDAMEIALRYTEAGLQAQMAAAAELLQPLAQEREERTRHNAALGLVKREDEGRGFVDVAAQDEDQMGVSRMSPGGAALSAIHERSKAKCQAAREEERREATAAASDILASSVRTEEAEEISQAGDSLLAALGRTNPED
ncbi:MAG: hypothetical protein U1G08_18040 [Verrucomicrobiota bacterium]